MQKQKKKKDTTSIKKVTNINSIESTSEIESLFWKDLVKYWYKVPKPIRKILTVYLRHKLEDSVFNFLADESSGWFEEK